MTKYHVTNSISVKRSAKNDDVFQFLSHKTTINLASLRMAFASSLTGATKLATEAFNTVKLRNNKIIYTSKHIDYELMYQNQFRAKSMQVLREALGMKLSSPKMAQNGDWKAVYLSDDSKHYINLLFITSDSRIKQLPNSLSVFYFDSYENAYALSKKLGFGLFVVEATGFSNYSVYCNFDANKAKTTLKEATRADLKLFLKPIRSHSIVSKVLDPYQNYSAVVSKLRGGKNVVK